MARAAVAAAAADEAADAVAAAVDSVVAAFAPPASRGSVDASYEPAGAVAAVVVAVVAACAPPGSGGSVDAGDGVYGSHHTYGCLAIARSNGAGRWSLPVRAKPCMIMSCWLSWNPSAAVV